MGHRSIRVSVRRSRAANSAISNITSSEASLDAPLQKRMDSKSLLRSLAGSWAVEALVGCAKSCKHHANPVQRAQRPRWRCCSKLSSFLGPSTVFPESKATRHCQERSVQQEGVMFGAPLEKPRSTVGLSKIRLPKCYAALYGHTLDPCAGRPLLVLWSPMLLLVRRFFRSARLLSTVDPGRDLVQHSDSAARDSSTSFRQAAWEGRLGFFSQYRPWDQHQGPR